MRSRGQKTESVGTILDRILNRVKVIDSHGKEISLKKRIIQERAIQIWPKVVGDHISAHTQSLWVRDNTIFVQVDNSSWANDLVFLKEEIIKKMNSELGTRIIREINFRA